MMKKTEKNQVVESLALVMQLGISMIVPIVACTLFCVWLGEKTNLSWLPIIGFLVGALAGGESVYKLVKKYLKNNDKRI